MKRAKLVVELSQIRHAVAGFRGLLFIKEA
jgi:hypothetical protein